VLIAVSRSGRTSETIEAVDAFRRATAGPVFALTVGADSAIAHAGDVLLDASVGLEPGVVHVASLTTMLMTGLAALAELTGEAVQPVLTSFADSAPSFFNTALPLAEQLGGDSTIEEFTFLGSGPWRGIASEAMLKVKEMSHAPAESFHTLEFRHGFGTRISGRSLMVGFLSDRASAAEQAVLDEFRADQGARTVAIGAHATRATGGDTLTMPPHLPEWARLVLALPFAQRLALERARLNGLDPDTPLNLRPVILLDEPLTP
jgi:glucosamine--fructose-6-phosphate aminotransferase (isomerizing)